MLGNTTEHISQTIFFLPSDAIAPVRSAAAFGKGNCMTLADARNALPADANLAEPIRLTKLQHAERPDA